MKWLDRIGLARTPGRVSPVTVHHTDRLADIHGSAFARPWTADEFTGFLIDRSIRVDGLFLGRDKQPAGFVVSRSVLDEAEILSLALARAARGRGWSRFLLSHHLQTLAHAGIARVLLEVEDGNAPAIALYSRLGFRESGRRPGYYARPDGTRASASSMSLDLREPGGA